MKPEKFLDEVLDKLVDTLSAIIDWEEDDPDDFLQKRHLYIATTDGGVRGALLTGNPEAPLNTAQLTGVIATITADLEITSPPIMGFVVPGVYSPDFRKWIGTLGGEASKEAIEAAIEKYNPDQSLYVIVALHGEEPRIWHTEFVTHDDELFLSAPIEMDILPTERAAGYSMLACVLTDAITNKLTEVN